MSLQPRDMNDMTGWHKITCTDADLVMTRHESLPPWRVESSLTDPDGYHGPGVIFTEWWWDGMPLLRTYRPTGRDCEHYAAMDATAALEVASDD